MNEFVDVHRLLRPAVADQQEADAAPAAGPRESARFREAMADVRVELAKGPSPLVFSQGGATALLNGNTQFTRELAFEAIRLARQHKTDTVSKVHVEQARDGMIPTKASRYQTKFLTVGGIVTGVGLQEFIGFAFASGSMPKPQAIAMIVCLVVGIAMIMKGLPRTAES